MFECSNTEEVHNLIEFILDFMVNGVLAVIAFQSDDMAAFLAFIERVLQFPQFKYKLSKIQNLFSRFQRILEVQDISNIKNFDRHWRLWSIYYYLIDSKECLNYLVKFGYFSLL
jgi:hypothetical protein